MNYKKTYVPHNGYTPLCTIGECSLQNLEFGSIELTNGQDLTFETGDREVAFVILGASFSFGDMGKYVKELFLTVGFKLVVYPALFLGVAILLGFRDAALAVLLILLSGSFRDSIYAHN